MTGWASVGSFIESHRAKGSHPDRRNIYSHTARFRLRPNFRNAIPNGWTTIPDFPTAFPNDKATATKAADASDAYEHILTIQNAADLQYPASDPANAPIRAEFRIGIFPPDHHAPPAPPTPTPPAK